MQGLEFRVLGFAVWGLWGLEFFDKQVPPAPSFL